MNKGLDALKRLFIKIKHYDSLDEKVMLENDYSVIEKELKEKDELAQALSIITCENGDLLKYKKAFEIIKEKQVNVSALLELNNLQQYNDYCDMAGGCKKLVQDEYDLLKEALL